MAPPKLERRCAVRSQTAHVQPLEFPLNFKYFLFQSEGISPLSQTLVSFIQRNFNDIVPGRKSEFFNKSKSREWQMGSLKLSRPKLLVGVESVATISLLLFLLSLGVQLTGEFSNQNPKS